MVESAAMGGPALIFSSGRERISALVTAVILFAVTAALAPSPHRSMVEGRQVFQIVAFGRVISDIVAVLIGAPFVGIVWFGLHRVLGKLWPEREPVMVDKVYERPQRGYVTCKGDDPNSVIPIDNAAAKLQTAADYLSAEEPPPLRALMVGPELALREIDAFQAEIERWTAEATEDQLRDLIPAALNLAVPMDQETAYRLLAASNRRGIPSFFELLSFMKASGRDDLREWILEEMEKDDSGS